MYVRELKSFRIFYSNSVQNRDELNYIQSGQKSGIHVFILLFISFSEH